MKNDWRAQRSKFGASEARELAKRLVQSVGSRVLSAMVIDDRIVFVGGKDGMHSLVIGASSRERVLAHWAGYVENNEAVSR